MKDELGGKIMKNIVELIDLSYLKLLNGCLQ